MRARRYLLPLLLAACGSPRPERAPAREPTVVASLAVPAAAPAAVERWIPGDLHEHVSPPDRNDVTVDVAAVVAMAHERGLEFVVLTPHMWNNEWVVPEVRDSFVSKWKKLVEAAAAPGPVTLLPGTEYAIRGVGHFGVLGADLAALCTQAGDSGCDPMQFLAAARAAGGFITVNHPFAVPTNIPGVGASHHDMSFRPWTSGTGEVPALDAVEIWNLPLSLANIVSTPGGETGETRALARADQLVHTLGRRIALVGGSDNHTHMLWPTTWVRARDRSAAAILAGLQAGRVCVGSPDAGDLEARGERDPAGTWQGIGGVVTGGTVTLRWHGEGELFVDGQSRGVHDGGLTVTSDLALHTFRLVKGRSRCGFLYANLR